MKIERGIPMYIFGIFSRILLACLLTGLYSIDICNAQALADNQQDVDYNYYGKQDSRMTFSVRWPAWDGKKILEGVTRNPCIMLSNDTILGIIYKEKIFPKPKVTRAIDTTLGRALSAGRKGYDIGQPYLKSIFFNLTEIRSLNYTGDSGVSGSLFFRRCYLKDVSFHYGAIEHVVFDGCTAGDVELEDMTVGEMNFQADCENLIFNGSTFRSLPKIEFISRLPRYISFANCKFSFSEPLIDLDRLSISNDSARCVININGADVTKLKFNYSNFIIDTTGLSFESLQLLYNNLKEQYQKIGMTSSLEAVDIDQRHFEARHRGLQYRLFDWVNALWWKYGYDKGRVFKNSLVLFLFFFITNLCLGLNRLLVYGYNLESYNDILDYIKSYKDPASQMWLRFWYTFLFTCLVFWGIRLEKDKLRLRNLGYIFYILLQYLVGIVCLAYLAAFILSK